MVKKKWSEYVWCTCEVEYAHTGARTEPKQKHAVYIALTVQRVSLMNDTATSHVEIQLFGFSAFLAAFAAIGRSNRALKMFHE